MNIANIVIPKDYMQKIINNIEYNKVILDYYSRYLEETKDRTLMNKINKIQSCNRFWIMDKYELQKVKDYKRTNLCNDKFCNNCKKVKQASRMKKFIPYLEDYKENLYHMVLTVPNVQGDQLEDSIKRQFKAFRRIIRYLAGDLKIKGIDFSQYGYEGAVRSLEVTFKGNTYHPHQHIGIVLNGKFRDKLIENTYSIDHYKNREKRLFNDFEILIQKLYYLTYNGQTVTKKAIDELKEGYSCSIDKFKEDDFAELFKYMTKATDEESENLTYSNFKTLYEVLYRVRQIQGYGCLYNVSETELNDEVEEIYNQLINELQEKENPEEVRETPQELIKDIEYTHISRKRIYSLLRKL